MFSFVGLFLIVLMVTFFVNGVWGLWLFLDARGPFDKYMMAVTTVFAFAASALLAVLCYDFIASGRG
jgi:hypothetical protein